MSGVLHMRAQPRFRGVEVVVAGAPRLHSGDGAAPESMGQHVGVGCPTTCGESGVPVSTAPPPLHLRRNAHSFHITARLRLPRIQHAMCMGCCQPRGTAITDNRTQDPGPSWLVESHALPARGAHKWRQMCWCGACFGFGHSQNMLPSARLLNNNLYNRVRVAPTAARRARRGL